MDYLTISELYHTQMKGRKHDGNWYYQYKDTGNYTDAGFLRYYGKMRGIPRDVTLKAAERTYLKGSRPDYLKEMDEVVAKISSNPELAKQFSEFNKASTKTEPKKEESPDYIKLLAQERAKQNYEKMQSDKNDSQKQEFDAMKKYNEQAQILDAYEKNRKKYNPTKVEETEEALKALAEGSKQFAQLIPNDGGRKKYGSYPNMSNEELNERINRISRERTYSDMIGDTEYIKSGKEKLREFFQTATGVLTLGSLAIAIAKPLVKKSAEKATGG